MLIAVKYMRFMNQIFQKTSQKFNQEGFNEAFFLYPVISYWWYSKFSRTWGPCATLLTGKTFVESYDCIITLIWRGESQSIKWSLFVNHWISFTQGFFMPSLVEIGPVVFEKKNFKFRQFISAISLSSPLGKGCAPLFQQTRIPYFSRILPSLVEIVLVVLEKKMKMWRILAFKVFCFENSTSQTV